MSKERDILKSLLLREELQLLEQIKQKVLSQEQFTQEVSKVLGGAIRRAQKEDKSFERALSIPIQKGVSRAFSDNKQSIIDGLLPIMGQLIRKTVTHSIKQFVADINRTLELGFSTKALKWRWQAFQTGQSFAEIVFQKTIRYQVNEIFLINQENGLLIEHVGTADMLKDNNAISAMLSVIREFIGDSLQSPDDNLQSAEMGDNLLFFSHGPKAFLVFVIKGLPTERFKLKAQQLIENVHAEFSDVLINQQNYRNNADLQNYLRNHLITKSRSDQSKKINWTPWIVGALIVILSLGYWFYKRNELYSEVVNLASSTDGLYVQSIKREGDKFVVKGLVDPMADITALQRQDTVLNTKPYFSLDDAIIEKRVRNIASDITGIHFSVDNQILTIQGNISPDDHKKLVQRLNSVMGIKKIINEMIVDNSPDITAFVESYFTTNKQVKFVVSNNHLAMAGTLTYDEHLEFTHKIKRKFLDISIDVSKLNIVANTLALINSINITTINTPLLDQKDAKQNKLLVDTINTLQQLIKREVSFKLTIVGQSDCNGALSDEYSLKRAEKIRSILLQHAINPTLLSTKILSCDRFDKPKNEEKRVVSFLVKQIEKDNENR